MSSSEQRADVARFTVENVGGIEGTTVDVPPGVTVLTGKNATNRTSFLQSIMAAMGSDRATLKGDADEGRVALEFGGDTYERTLTRTASGVQFTGDGYLDDPSVAEQFAFLLESNEARRAVAREEDLREIIMRPVDVEDLKRDIERLEREKGEINDELATIESRKTDLPDLERQRTSLEEDIEEKRAELAELEAEIDESSRDVEESRQEQQELEEKLDELRSTRSDLESVRRDIEAQQTSIESLEDERADVEDELAELPEAPMGDHAHLEDDIERLRSRRQRLNSEISDLQSLIQYNEERLEEGDYDVLESLDDAADGGNVTDQLVAGDGTEVVCWTCGTTVEREQIEATVDRLQDLRAEKIGELDELKADLEDRKEQKREAERAQRRREDLESQLEDIKDELQRRRERLDELKDRRETLTAAVEDLEAAVDDLESEDFEEVLELHREANQLEFEIDSLESDLEEVTDEIAEIEAMVERADDLRDERDALVEELTDRRTKIDRIEQEAVEAFNEHMDAILDVLGYENLERVWIERVEETVRDGRQKVEQTAFELHVVRSTRSGTAYEDTIEHLSESEREVTGLIFALAGYLVHDLHETVPFMLLDSLEAIDADRIAELVDYFAEYAEYLVVALLEEDAAHLDDAYHRITDI